MSETTIEGYEPSGPQLRAWRVAAFGSEGGSSLEAEAELIVTGEVDVDRVSAALADLFARHEVLRTELRVLHGLSLPLAVIGERPVWRASVRPRADGEWSVHLTGPAYGLDAWSLSALCRELALAYDGRLASEAEPLQHADAAAWQQEILEDEHAADGKAYWQAADAGPSDRNGLPYPSGSGVAATAEPVRVPLDPRGCTALLRLGDDVGRSLPSVLLAAWATLLARVVGRDVTIGVASDGRNYPDLAGAVGPYGRYLPVRLATRDAASFTRLAADAAELPAAHAEWQEYADWPPGGEISATVPFALDVVDFSQRYEAGGAVFGVARWRGWLDRCGVRLLASRTGDGLELAIEYDPARYEVEDIEYLAAQLGALLADLDGHADDPPASLSVLTTAQRQFLLDEVNRADGANDAESSGAPIGLHRLVEQVVQRSPDRVAIRAQAEAVTYGELNRRAEQLAGTLQTRGVRRGDLVGVLLHGGVEATVAMLGVLKAGAAFVPLDPAYPPARLRQALEGQTSTVVITLAKHADALAGVVDLLYLDAGAAPGSPAEPDGSAAGVAAAGDDLAYVNLTSGSPGAAMSTHLGVVSTVRDLNRRLGLTGDDRLLTVAPPTLDTAVYDVFGPLAAGATVVYSPPVAALDPESLAELIERERITVLTAAPALFGLLVERVRRSTPAALGSLRLAVLSGERLLATTAARAGEVLPALRIAHTFGVAEASMYSTVHEVEAARAGVTGSATVPIGRSLANQPSYVLDDRLQPCPVWVAGRLVLAGVGLGPGYLSRGGLTAQRFLPDPYGTSPGGRMVLTDHLARRRPDGTLEWLGRVSEWGTGDPAAVTAVLLDHAAVRDAVTVLRDDRRDDRGEGRREDGDPGPTLVSYVVGDTDPYQLRAHLTKRLGAELVPAELIVVPALPLTANGRIDRVALPVPGAQVAEYVAPQNPLEEELVGMAAEVLAIERVGMMDNFFKAGGHSLQLAQLAGRIAEHFHVDVPLQALFEAETFQEIANLVLSAQLAGVDAAELDALVADLDTEDKAG